MDTGGWTFAGLRAVTDVRHADWLARQLHDRRSTGNLVSSLLPGNYPAYGRCLHAIRVVENQSIDHYRWSDVAAHSGHAVNIRTRLADILDWPVGQDHPSAPYLAPLDGSLNSAEMQNLAEVLTHFTATPDKCWFAFWDGYGLPELSVLAKRQPTARVRGLDCLIFAGAIEPARIEVASEPQSPTWWWPDDRAWCVGTDIDSFSTYIAASIDCISHLVSQSGLEVLRDRVDSELDNGPFA